MQFLCPQCQQPLTEEPQRWHCRNQHSYDKAKQGYCNLLLAQNKRSKMPGDSSEMVQARKRFLSQGHYQPIAHQAAQWLQTVATDHNSLSVLDAGCGEGYYTHYLHQHLLNQSCTTDIAGIDISKFAVKAAAGRNKDITWFVANSAHLPVPQHSVDVLLSLFSPIPKQAFKQALKPDGYLFIASTAKDHLIELREKLYDRIKQEVLNPELALAPEFQVINKANCRYAISLDKPQDILDILAMTPHYWRASPEKKAALATLQAIDLTIDINLYLLRC